MNRALRDNDLIDWKPENQLIMLYCTGDEIVHPHNSAVAWLVFFLRGATNTMALNLGPMNHSDCAIPALAVAKILFDFNSGMNPSIFSPDKKTIPAELNMNDLRLSEARMIADNYEIEELNEIYRNLDLNGKFDLKENPRPGLVLFPNPASDHFTVMLDLDSTIEEISLVNVLGQKVRVYHNPGSTGSYTIECGDVPSGIYNLVVKARGTYMKRIVIE